MAWQVVRHFASEFTVHSSLKTGDEILVGKASKGATRRREGCIIAQSSRLFSKNRSPTEPTERVHLHNVACGRLLRWQTVHSDGFARACSADNEFWERKKLRAQRQEDASAQWQFSPRCCAFKCNGLGGMIELLIPCAQLVPRGKTNSSNPPGKSTIEIGRKALLRAHLVASTCIHSCQIVDTHRTPLSP